MIKTDYSDYDCECADAFDLIMFFTFSDKSGDNSDNSDDFVVKMDDHVLYLFSGGSSAVLTMVTGKKSAK